MRRRLKVVGQAGLLLLAAAASARAQAGGTAPVAKRKFNHRATIESIYDKEHDRTSVVMQWYPVSEEPKEPVIFSQTRPPQVRIRAAFAYDGCVLTETPPAVKFDVGADYEGPSLFRDKEMPELTAVVDGERISLGKTVLERSKTTVGIFGPRQTTIESLSATFNYQGLLRLANAGKVSMRAGSLEFELKERHLEALRDLASRMVP